MTQPWAKRPWTYDEYGHVVDADGKQVLVTAGAFATHYSNASEPDEESKTAAANTRLFFAAGKLYMACRFAIAKLDDGGAHLYSPQEVEQVINAMHDAMGHAKRTDPPMDGEDVPL